MGWVGQGQHLFWWRILLCKIQPQIPPKKRIVPARAWRKGGLGGIPPAEPIVRNFSSDIFKQTPPVQFSIDRPVYPYFTGLSELIKIQKSSTRMGFELFLSKTTNKEASPAVARKPRHPAKKFSSHFLICARRFFSSKRKRKLFCGVLL